MMDIHDGRKLQARTLRFPFNLRRCCAVIHDHSNANGPMAREGGRGYRLLGVSIFALTPGQGEVSGQISGSASLSNASALGQQLR
jgi:hypothetical protein